jgi:predicted glycosyltransferase
MKILVDVVHPAHVHFFRHAMEQWRQDGDEVLVTARRKDVTLDLLRQMGVEAHELSTAGRGLGGLLREKAGRDFAMARIARKWGAQVLLSVSGPHSQRGVH